MKNKAFLITLIIVSVLVLAMLACVAVVLLRSNKPEKPADAVTTTATPTAGPIVTSAVTTTENSGEKTYFITFYSGTEMLAKVECREGEIPDYPGSIPKKESDELNDYVFKGWEPEIVPATEGAMYKAVFDSIDRTVKVRFMNADGTQIEEISVPYKTAAAPTVTPTDHEDGKFFCKFLGWTTDAEGKNPANLSSVRSDLVVYAAYELQQVKSYVKYILDDGTVYKEDYVTIGETPAPETPVKESTDQYSYKFTGWTPELAPIGTEDVVYTASFEAELRSYTVKFIDSKRETEKSVSVKYGEPAVYPGDTSDLPYGAYTLHFEHWAVSATLTDEADISAITGDLTVYAYYSYLNVTREDISFSGSATTRVKDVDKVYVTVEWTSERKAGSPTATVTVKAKLTSYTISELGSEKITVKFGSKTASDYSPVIKSFGNNSTQTSMTLYEHTFTVDVPDAMPHTETLTFDWDAGLKYSIIPKNADGSKQYKTYDFSLTTEVKY